MLKSKTVKFYFKPLPVLTVVTFISLVILIALGTWQFKRLQWKTVLLAEIEQVAEAPPFTSLKDVQAALDRGEPVDFRRIGIRGEVESQTPFLVYTSESRDVSWRVFAATEQDGVKAFVDLDIVSDEKAKSLTEIPASSELIVGYVRLARPYKWGQTKSSPDDNRWFGFNPMAETHDWAKKIGGADMRFYIEREKGAVQAEVLPARRPDIRNNHFDYMLTWYGLAAALFVIYLIMHHRAGCLGRKATLNS